MLKKILAVLVMLYATLALAAVDVNKANEAQLDAIRGIGPITSKLIMAERKKGEFKSWEDFIERVKGIGDDRAAKLSAEGLTVNGVAYKDAAATKKDPKKADKATKEEKKAAKDVKKDAKAEVKSDKKDVKAAVKDEKKDAKAAAAKPAASAAKK